jgi:hypothetical protein
MSEEVIESPGATSDLYNALDRLNIRCDGRETFETAAPDVLARRKIVHRRPRPGDPPKEQHKPCPPPPPPPPKQTYSRGSSGSTEAVNGGRGAALIPYHSDSDSDDSITSPEVISAPSEPNNADKSPTKAAIPETVEDTHTKEEGKEEKEDSSMLENGKAKTKTTMTTRATSHKGKARGKTAVTKGRAAFEATGETA